MPRMKLPFMVQRKWVCERKGYGGGVRMGCGRKIEK